MQDLNLQSTQDTPRVSLSKSKNLFEISGRSLPEDSVEFYRPILAWIDEYAKAPNATTAFNFKLEYFNTSSSKLILDLLNELKKIKGMRIVWFYYEDDEAIDDAGKEYAEQVDVPFEFKPID